MYCINCNQPLSKEDDLYCENCIFLGYDEDPYNDEEEEEDLSLGLIDSVFKSSNLFKGNTE